MNADDAARFWRERVAARGHTGWADDIVYAWDQRERLDAFSAFVRTLGLAPGKALDFGCGTGDLSRRLLSDGWRVFGYDPYVAATVRDVGFTQIAQLADLPGPVDLICSMTVLDHILADDAFAETLRALRGACTPRGALVVVEYALDDDDAWSPSNEHQSFRRVSAWRDALAAAGWRLDTITPMPQPMQSPSTGWRRYRGALSSRLVARIPARAARLRRRLIDINARALYRTLPEQAPHRAPSPLKRMVCRPMTEAP